MDREDQAWLRALEVVSLCSLPMALKAAIHLHVLDILAHHGGGGQDEPHFLSASQIVSHLGHYPSVGPVTCAPSTASASLDRILRVLASHDILASSSLEPIDSRPVATYALTPLALYFLHKPSGEGSLAPLSLFLQDSVFMKPFFNLHESVLDGTLPFTKAHGLEVFSYAQTDARFSQLLIHAMSGHSTLLMQELLKTYTGFKDINSLVDVGGGIGTCLNIITTKYPHIKGINFDLPHVIQGAPEYPGVEHVGGNMFVSVPKGEVILMKWILHDWSDESCLKILKNCFNALPTKGKVMVVDIVLPNRVEHDLGSRLKYQADLIMFANTGGGKERTKEELLSISKEAGFPRLEVICKAHECSVIEIFKEDF